MKNVSMSLFPQKANLGYIKRHKNNFLAERSKCVSESALETNRLIIRLDKLITNTPDDVSKRKAFEKEVVPWISDKDVNRCSDCSNPFNMTRRKHHCRLCGNVICHNCSKYLSFVIANKLINPAYAAKLNEVLTSAGKDIMPQAEPEKQSLVQSFKRMSSSATVDSFNKVRHRSEKILSHLINQDDSEVSLFSLLQQDAEEKLRICCTCKTLLDQRDEAMDQMVSSPIISQMYDQLITKLKEIANLTPSYRRMAQSLSQGESLYTLEEASKHRKTLALKQRDVDILSGKIEVLGTTSEHMKMPTNSDLLLQKRIRMFAVASVQNTIIGMPTLPTEKEYRILQEELRKKVLEDLRKREEEQRLLKSLQHSHSSHSIKKDYKEKTPISNGTAKLSSSIDSGWTPSPGKSTSASHLTELHKDLDPLQQQYLNIKHFLQQAIADGRTEEMDTLSQNLKLFETEILNNNLFVPS
uniref:FYVE-type domain-containing protein n=1 Tax=Rhabditophanes sp. KR3021 TaxID=114890 RepID=A0AC35U8A0_9BILA